MSKRFFGALVIAALAMTLTSVVAAPSADAGNDCAPGPVFRDAMNTHGNGSGAIISGEEELYVEFEGDRAELRVELVADLADRQLAAEDPAYIAYTREVLTWLDRGPCNEKIAYNGPFTNHPPAPTGAYGWGAPNVVAAASVPAAGTGGGDAAAPLAHTGLDTAIPGMLGATMLGAGLLIEGGRRRRKNA